jgi:hypothetical protein
MVGQEKRGLVLRRYLAATLVALPLGVALAACGFPLGGGGSTISAGPTATFVIYATQTPDTKTAVQQTVVAFCQALSDSKFSAAYSYLTPSFKSRVGRASNLPYVLEHTWGKTLSCMEFGNGGFIHGSGGHAQDSVEFVVYLTNFGSDQNITASLNLTLINGSWKIDLVS